MQPPAARPAVVALIPCHRGRPAGVAALLRQDHPVTVRVLSNGPAGPRAVAGASVRRVAWEGHGDTRLRAAHAEVADFLLFLSDDAVPVGPRFVSALLAAAATTGADAVVARQVPRPDADPVTAARIAAWTPPHPTGPRAFPQADHVGTLWRRSALLAAATPGVSIGEDLVWSRGRPVVLAPDAVVVHSHPRAPRALWEREVALHAVRAAAGLPPTVPGLGALIRGLPGVAGVALRHGPRQGLCAAAEAAGQWWGGRVGAR